MHISEGVLSPAVLCAGAALGAAGLAIGLKAMRQDQVVPTGVMAAAFFVASLIHVPVGVASAHLLLTGMVGVILGWAAFPAIFTALALQALFFQYGGLTTLGVNLTSMGLGAVGARWLFASLQKYLGVSAAAFAGGAFGVAASGFLTALALACSNEGFFAAAVAIFAAHLPVMLAEGAITMAAVKFLAKLRPEILGLSSGGA